MLLPKVENTHENFAPERPRQTVPKISKKSWGLSLDFSSWPKIFSLHFYCLEFLAQNFFPPSFKPRNYFWEFLAPGIFFLALRIFSGRTFHCRKTLVCNRNFFLSLQKLFTKHDFPLLEFFLENIWLLEAICENLWLREFFFLVFRIFPGRIFLSRKPLVSRNFRENFLAAGIFFTATKNFSDHDFPPGIFSRKYLASGSNLWEFVAPGIFFLAFRIFPGRIFHYRKTLMRIFGCRNFFPSLQEFFWSRFSSRNFSPKNWLQEPICENLWLREFFFLSL